MYGTAIDRYVLEHTNERRQFNEGGPAPADAAQGVRLRTGAHRSGEIGDCVNGIFNSRYVVKYRWLLDVLAINGILILLVNLDEHWVVIMIAFAIGCYSQIRHFIEDQG